MCSSPPVPVLKMIVLIGQAMDHLHNAEKKDEEAHIVSVEEHYKSIDKDIKTIEHLIEEADKADHSDVRDK